MTGACPGWSPSLAPVLRLTRFVDCRAHAIGENGYQALSGSPLFTALLAGLLVLCVALFGLRLMLGDRFDTARGLSLAMRIGVTLALATSWPAYQALVYRVVVEGPAEVSSILLPAAGLDHERPAVARIDALYTVMTQKPDAVPVSGVSTGDGATKPPTAGLDAFEQAATATGFLISALGAWLALRLVAGLLLALGPLFACGLLFEATRGLFVGWVRALVGTIGAAVGIDLALSLELATLENQLSPHEAAIGADMVPVDWGLVFGIVAIFAILLCAVILAALWVASAIRSPPARLAPPQSARAPYPVVQPVHALRDVSARLPDAAPAGVDPRSRAAAIGVAIRTMGLREQAFSERRREGAPATTGGSAGSPDGLPRRRTTAPRQSASLSRRDAL